MKDTEFTVRAIADMYDASTHLFCHPKVNVFCHAGTRSVKDEAQHFVRTPTYFVRAADGPGKTKAINPFCATAQNQKRRYHPIV